MTAFSTQLGQRARARAGMPVRRRERRGFTLVELIVGAVITAFVVTATTVSLGQAMRTREASGGRMQALARAAAAVDRIARDVETAVRDPVVYHTRVLVMDNVARGSAADELLVYSRSLRRARPETVPGSGIPAEGGEYEVHYRLGPAHASGPRRAATSTARDAVPAERMMILWRRVDPVPDEIPDGGGVASPVEGGILALSILATDGQSWFESWDSDYSGYPHAVRITVSAADDSGRYTSIARRTVALDRTPLPLTVSPAEEDAPADPAAAPAGPTAPAAPAAPATPGATPRGGAGGPGAGGAGGPTRGGGR